MPFVRADTPEGQSIRAMARAKALEIADRISRTKDLSIEVHEISPDLLELTTYQLPASRQFTIEDSCALVFCGFYINDATDGRVVRIQRGREYLTDLVVTPINTFSEGKEGVDAAFKAWGVWVEGEDFSLGFRTPAPSSAVEAFLVGYIVIPEGKMDIVK